MNEDIAQVLLAMEARITQQNQRLADLEFQVRQAHRDLARVQRLLSGVTANVETLAEREYARSTRDMSGRGVSATWPGRTRLS